MRKKISISLATAFLMISGSAYADGNITGTVFNKTTSEPLDFATVVLVKAETGALLPIGTGKFSIEVQKFEGFQAL